VVEKNKITSTSAEHSLPILDLKSEGMIKLAALTNDQFSVWGRLMKEVESDEKKPGSHMDYWASLTILIPEEGFELDKKMAFERIAAIQNVSLETARKYVAAVESMELIESVRRKGTVFIRLTDKGERLIATTLTKWAYDFGDLHRQFFAGLKRPA